jgi:iron complex outermembrane receptor protein
MLKKNLFTLILVLFITQIFGQNIKVIDKKTKEVVAYADVFFPELNTATTTDNNGIFTIKNLTIEKVKIQISFVGYKTLSTYINPKKTSTLELEPSHIALQGVVVSVPGGKLENENVVAIENRKIKELYTSSPTNLSTAIAEIPGVEQITVGASVGKPVIRGLSGNRILTYALGIRVENQQWGADHGMGINDIGIESVEVIKGPASLLYGSDALAGIIYFVDARYAKQNSAEGSIRTKYFSNNKQLQTDFGFKINKGKFSFNVFGGMNSAADFTLPNGNSVYNSRFEDKNMKVSLGYLNKNWISNLRYSYFENYYGMVGSDSTYTNNKVRNIDIPFVNLTNNSLSFDNTLFLGESKLNLILGYSNDIRKAVKIDMATPNINMELETFTYNLKWYSPQINDNLSLIVGSQGMHQTNANSGLGMVIPNATTKDIGLFSLVNFSLGKFDFQGGLRGDYRQINSEEKIMGGNVKFPELNTDYVSINYSLGGVYKLENINLRANISSGFRAPNSAELLSNGILGSVNRYVKGNHDLISEQSNQIDFSFNYTTEHINFSVNPFFNKINNYIYLAPTGEVLSGAPVYEYTQKDANLYGGEMGVHFHPHGLHWLHIRSDVSTVFAEDKSGEPLPLIPATRFNNTLKVQFKQKEHFTVKSIFVQDIYKLEQNRVGQFETASDSYNLVNIGANMEVKTKSLSFDIDAGVKNLLNTEYIDHLSRLKDFDLSAQGINFYLGVKFNIKYKM